MQILGRIPAPNWGELLFDLGSWVGFQGSPALNIQGPRAPLCCDDCVERAFDRAYPATVTSVHIYEGGLITVDANDSFDLTCLLRQTNPANVATIVVNG